MPALKLFHDYLPHRKQNTRVNNSHNEWLAIVFGLPQSSVLGPILFNIFFSRFDFVYSDIDITNFPDNNTLYRSAKNVGDVETLEQASVSLFRGCQNNLFVKK